jgi:hypothetical protein
MSCFIYWYDNCRYDEYHYAEFRVWFIVVLGVVILNVRVNIFMQNVRVSVFILNVRVGVVILNVMLNVVMLNAVAPLGRHPRCSEQSTILWFSHLSQGLFCKTFFIGNL